MKTEQKASSKELGDLFGAMAKAQACFLPIKKTAKGYHGLYADLNDIYESTRKALAENDLSVMQSVSDGGVTTVIGHKSGQHLIFETTWTRQSSLKLLAMGGQFTLMRRYALQAVLNVSGNDDAEKLIEDMSEPSGEIKMMRYSPVEEAEDLVDTLQGITSNRQFLDWQTENKEALDRLRKNPSANSVLNTAVIELKKSFK